MLKWILGIWLIDWLETSSQCCVRDTGEEEEEEERCFLARWECEVLLSVGYPQGDWAIRPIQSQQFDPVRVQSMFMMKLYICVSTTKWTGRQERRSWVAGSHVSQERALYCSRTNLSGRETQRIVNTCLNSVTGSSPHLKTQTAAYLSTSEVWLESSGWECLLCRNSSDWTEDRCREACGKKKKNGKT